MKFEYQHQQARLTISCEILDELFKLIPGITNISSEQNSSLCTLNYRMKFNDGSFFNIDLHYDDILNHGLSIFNIVKDRLAHLRSNFNGYCPLETEDLLNEDEKRLLKVLSEQISSKTT